MDGSRVGGQVTNESGLLVDSVIRPLLPMGLWGLGPGLIKNVALQAPHLQSTGFRSHRNV